jgi:predicted nucleic acid-binding protein
MNTAQSDSLPVYVLDSFAMLAYLGGEAGMRRVRAVLTEASLGRCRVLLSIINLGEVLYITERQAGLPQAQAVLAAIEQLPIEVLPATSDTVFTAAHLKANYRIAYADAFAVAAAQASGGILLSGDPEFAEVEGIVPVEWLERR